MKPSGKTRTILFLLLSGILLFAAGGYRLLLNREPAPVQDSTKQTSTASSTAARGNSTNADTQTGTATQSDLSAESTSEDDTAAAYAQAYAYAGFTPAIAQMNDQNWNLLLVNRYFALPEDYTPKLEPCISADPNSLLLDYRVAPYYKEMYLAAKQDGITLTPISGYRSFERQKNNFERQISEYEQLGNSRAQATRLAAESIQIPGASEHNAGLAMDICSLLSNFDKTPEYAWLQEHAAEYGFIQRYTAEKKSITGVIPEPWHWRYVGKEHAKNLQESGQCLEEYLGRVQ